MHFCLPKRALLAVGSLFGILAIAFIVTRFLLPRTPKDNLPPTNLSVDQSIEDFFTAYWQRPIPLQGLAPALFTEKEASLTPEACGSCHPQQYSDWKESVHSKAMGPGPWGQIIDLFHSSPDEAKLCMTCHAPLSEQSLLVAKSGTEEKGPFEKNPYFDSRLELQGITCAACHVRQHRRFGPPKAEALAA